MTTFAPFDQDSLDRITTVRISSVFVIRDQAMREQAIKLFKDFAWQLHVSIQAMGDRRASTKVEHRDGIDAWTIEDIELPLDKDDVVTLQAMVNELTPDFSRPAVSDQIDEMLGLKPEEDE